MRRSLVTKLLLAVTALILLTPNAASALCADCSQQWNSNSSLYGIQNQKPVHSARATRYQQRTYRYAYKPRVRAVATARYSPPIAQTPAAVPVQVITGTMGAVRQLVDFFIGKGWSAAQAFGLVANFYVESRLLPHVAANGGQFVGIAQWDRTRQATFHKKYGKAVRQASLIEQAEFAHWELTNTAATAGAMLKTAKTPAEAAAIVSRQYERPTRDEAYTRGLWAQKLALAVNIPQQNVAAVAPTALIKPEEPKPLEPKPQLLPGPLPIIANVSGVNPRIVAFLQQVQAKCGPVKVISGVRNSAGQMCHMNGNAVDYQITDIACAFNLASTYSGGHTSDYHGVTKLGVPPHFHLSWCPTEMGWRGIHQPRYAYGPRYVIRYAQRTRMPRHQAQAVRPNYYMNQYATAH